MSSKNLGIKSQGQVFTPKYIVSMILDKADYVGSNILNKKILEPSFGDGQFLSEIVNRFIKIAKKHNWDDKEIRETLSKNIVGIEIDKHLLSICRKRLNSILEKHSIDKVNWRLKNQNALLFKSREKFDFVVGNPPYIKVHNLDNDTKNILKNNFNFCKNGTIDTYLAFFELGLNLLKDKGDLVYITPNMFLKNTSNQGFRNYLTKNNLITDLINFGSFNVFKGVNTYNCITKLKKGNQGKKINYFLWNKNHRFPNGNLKKVNEIKIAPYYNQKFNFMEIKQEQFINQINKKPKKVSDFAEVRYGFATLRDKVYICNEIKTTKNTKYVVFNGKKIEAKLLKKVIKGSKMYKNNKIKTAHILFPYKKEDGRYVVREEKEFKDKYPFGWRYLSIHKKDLLSRDLGKNTKWYEYGRSQAIQSVHNQKIVVNFLVNDNVNVEIVNSDVMVYAGIFILTKSEDITLENIKDSLKGSQFLEYARLLGKDMRNDYKMINSKIIKDFPIGDNK